MKVFELDKSSWEFVFKEAIAIHGTKKYKRFVLNVEASEMIWGFIGYKGFNKYISSKILR
jgi:hypothetical protein